VNRPRSAWLSAKFDPGSSVRLRGFVGPVSMRALLAPFQGADSRRGMHRGSSLALRTPGYDLLPLRGREMASSLGSAEPARADRNVGAPGLPHFGDAVEEWGIQGGGAIASHIFVTIDAGASHLQIGNRGAVEIILVGGTGQSVGMAAEFGGEQFVFGRLPGAPTGDLAHAAQAFGVGADELEIFERKSFKDFLGGEQFFAHDLLSRRVCLIGAGEQEEWQGDGASQSENLEMCFHEFIMAGDDSAGNFERGEPNRGKCLWRGEAHLQGARIRGRSVSAGASFGKIRTTARRSCMGGLGSQAGRSIVERLRRIELRRRRSPPKFPPSSGRLQPLQ
jgi:hypothetical protein